MHAHDSHSAHDENVYDALSTADDDGRWAFGTGFDAGDAEITAPAPDGVDRADLATYCLMLADDALIASQRLAGWTAKAPELEEEVALANIALDLLGQARVLLSRAGHLGAAEPYRDGPQDDEDVLTYFRDDRAFRNVTLAEADLGDFGRTIAWILVFSAWRLALMQRLTGSRDPVLAAVAGKAVKELTYHRDYAAQWVLRLGDGTELSHVRMQAGLDGVWPHVEELFLRPRRRASPRRGRRRGRPGGAAGRRRRGPRAGPAGRDADPPRDARGRPRRRSRGPRRGAHRGPRRRPRAHAVARPRAPGGDMVTALVDAREAAERVVDPEMPMLTLADLGVLRGVETAGDGTVVVTLTPTYSGCPALDAMRDDLRAALQAPGTTRSRCARPSARRGPPTGSPTRAAASSPRPASPRPTGSGRRPRAPPSR